VSDLNLKEELELERHRAALRVAQDCRNRENLMMQFSLVIFGGVIWAALNLPEKLLFREFIGFSFLWFLAYLMILIGLFVSKLNAVEQLHYRIEKLIYIQNDVFIYKSGGAKDFNKIILLLVYSLLIIVAFIGSTYFLSQPQFDLPAMIPPIWLLPTFCIIYLLALIGIFIVFIVLLRRNLFFPPFLYREELQMFNEHANAVWKSLIDQKIISDEGYALEKNVKKIIDELNEANSQKPLFKQLSSLLPNEESKKILEKLIKGFLQ